MAGASTLIKGQEDKGHLKETAANQTADKHTNTHTHTQASRHRRKVNMSIHADNTGKETCHQQKHTSSIQPLIKMVASLAKCLSNNGVCLCVCGAGCSAELDFPMPAAPDTTKT